MCLHPLAKDAKGWSKKQNAADSADGCDLGFDLLEGGFEGSAAAGVGGSARKDQCPLQFKRLLLALARGALLGIGSLPLVLGKACVDVI